MGIGLPGLTAILVCLIPFAVVCILGVLFPQWMSNRQTKSGKRKGTRNGEEE